MYYELYFFFSFTPYPAHSRVGIKNPVLRYSVPYLPTNSGGIAYQVAALNAALRLGRIDYMIFIISWGSHPQPAFTVTH